MKKKLLLGTGAGILAGATPSQAGVLLYTPSNPAVINAMLVMVLLMVVILAMQAWEIIIHLRHAREKQDALLGLPKVQRVTWFDLFTRKHVQHDEETDSHVYDDIHEYDNSPPAWFNWLFYGSIVCAAGYMLNYHVFKTGKLQEEEYADQMKEGEKLLAKAQEKAILLADQPRYTDEAKLLSGQKTYAANCAMCHGEQGQGIIGPNLTDEYWLHGGSYKDVFKTIFNGVPEKGMLAWKKTLKPDELKAVASYVYTLRGTKPVEPKEPQGVKYTDDKQAGL